MDAECKIHWHPNAWLANVNLLGPCKNPCSILTRWCITSCSIQHFSNGSISSNGKKKQKRSLENLGPLSTVAGLANHESFPAKLALFSSKHRAAVPPGYFAVSGQETHQQQCLDWSQIVKMMVIYNAYDHTLLLSLSGHHWYLGGYIQYAAFCIRKVGIVVPHVGSTATSCSVVCSLQGQVSKNICNIGNDVLFCKQNGLNNCAVMLFRSVLSLFSPLRIMPMTVRNRDYQFFFIVSTLKITWFLLNISFPFLLPCFLNCPDEPRLMRQCPSHLLLQKVMMKYDPDHLAVAYLSPL